MKQFITRRSFIKAAGAATALTAVSVGAPAAFAEETNCFFGDKADVTILYTNDVHTYIDNKSPKPGMCCWWMQVTISRAPLTVPWMTALPSSS